MRPSREDVDHHEPLPASGPEGPSLERRVCPHRERLGRLTPAAALRLSTKPIRSRTC